MKKFCNYYVYILIVEDIYPIKKDFLGKSLRNPYSGVG